MKRIHLLRVGDEPDAFAPLLAAAAAAGLRVGWLELASVAVPDSLAAALAAGGERAVVVAERVTLVARPRRGPARLRELLRQQFLGCALVLARGEVDAPLLAPGGEERWTIRQADGAERRLATEELVAALRAPQPFPPAHPIT